jgi:bacteriocin biosynthesis cyclodehydratase domain-containing protein
VSQRSLALAYDAKVARLRNHPAWRLLLEDDKLIAVAGADELYLVDEVDAAGARALHDAWQAEAWEPLAAGPLGAAVAKLERLGAIQRTLSGPRPALSYAVLAVGDAGAFAGRLGALVEAGIAEAPLATADVVVIVRAAGPLLALGDAAAGLRVPHLLIDVAYHHTVSIGPLVWPGETACLVCLAGRIRHAWGDPEPPPAPAAGASPLATALVADALWELRRTGGCAALVERTVAFDLARLTSKSERVHRLPWCPRCFPEERPHGAGSFALPWKGS